MEIIMLSSHRLSLVLSSKYFQLSKIKFESSLGNFKTTQILITH